MKAESIPGRVEQGELFDLRRRAPDGFDYVPTFITPAEEACLLDEICELPLREMRYKSYLAKRRTLSFGSEYGFDDNRLACAPPIPRFLHALRLKVARWLGMPASDFAQALLSEYRSGTGLGWHRDAPVFGVVVGISLGAGCRMRFRSFTSRMKKKEDVLAMELEPRSAYVLRGHARWRWQHSISKTKELRYSITFRTLL